jgi:hypothetical protein
MERAEGNLAELVDVAMLSLSLRGESVREKVERK